MNTWFVLNNLETLRKNGRLTGVKALVAFSGTVDDPEVIVTLMQRQAARGRLSSLTPRETEVLSRMAQGDANTSIAERLVITEKAVQKHINAIFAKLGLAEEPTSARRVLAVLAFLRGAPPAS